MNHTAISDLPVYRDWLTELADKPCLRIGLVGADLHETSADGILAGLLGAAAAQAVAWYAYSDHDPAPSAVGRLRSFCAQWLETATLGDEQLAARIRDDRIDVLVHLSAGEPGHRQDLLARRPAPLQVSWPATSGGTCPAFMDGVIAGPQGLPGEPTPLADPTIWHLPRSPLSYSPPSDAPPVADMPAFRRGRLCFGSFGQAVALDDAVLAAWGRISQAAPHARWRLQARHLQPDSVAQKTLLARMADAGMDVARVRLVDSADTGTLLSAYAEVDVVLDRLTGDGGRAMEALWMGVPTLALTPPAVRACAAQQVLLAAGLGSWVTSTVDDYVSRAALLARPESWPALYAQRRRLRTALAESPLADTEGFARDWVGLVQSKWRTLTEAPNAAQGLG